jgi:Flp pilus assembly pilin Flp
MDKVMELYIRGIAELSAPRKGQGLVEYALIIALVSVLLVGSLAALRGGIEGVFTSIVNAF